MAEMGGTSNSCNLSFVFDETIWAVDLGQFPDRPCKDGIDGDWVISEIGRQNIALDSLKQQGVSVRHFIFVYNETGSTYLQEYFDLAKESDV